MEKVVIEIKRLHPDAVIPVAAHGYECDAGADLVSTEDKVFYPGDTIAVSTGIYIAMPAGFEGQIRSRSGMAKQGIVVANSPGTVDPGYRGEVKVLLHFVVIPGIEPRAFMISKGSRIAQLVIARYASVQWKETEELSDTIRGISGFGSTGT